MVTLVLGGDGMNTIDQVRMAVRQDRPVVIVTGSSRVPTLLAELFYVLEDKVPRSLVAFYHIFAKSYMIHCIPKKHYHVLDHKLN